MRANATVLFFLVAAATTGACGDRLLVGSNPDGGPLSGVAGQIPPTTGAAGQSSPTTGVAGEAPPTTGAAGQSVPTTGGGGTTGAAGTAPVNPPPPTTTRTVTPLWISAEEALTRVAQAVWKEAPSDDLLSQAKLGRFKTNEDLYGAVRQLLADPRARAGIGAFYRWWLQLDRLEEIKKDPQLFPAFTPQLAAEMAAETETFGVNVTLSAGGTLITLMTAPFSYINQSLADIYGVAGVTGSDLRQVSLDSSQRAGLVTQPALQALTSFEKRNSPSARGSYMLTRFECLQIPPPPPNTSGLDPLPTNVTVRQALAMSISQQTACQACHLVLDPPGLAFETFDAIGRWRTTDNGFPIDMSGIRVLNLSDDSSPIGVDGPVTLAHAMMRSLRVQDCMARQWLSYVTGKETYALDERVVNEVTAIFRASGLDLKELIAAVLTSDLVLAPK